MSAKVAVETMDTVEVDGKVVSSINARDRLDIVATSGKSLIKKVVATVL